MKLAGPAVACVGCPEIGAASFPEGPRRVAARQCAEPCRIGRVGGECRPVIVGCHQGDILSNRTVRQSVRLLPVGHCPAFGTEFPSRNSIEVVEQTVFFLVFALVHKDTCGRLGLSVPCGAAAFDDGNRRAVVQMLCFEVGCHPVEVADFHDGIFIAVDVLDRLCRFGFRLGFRNIFVFDATDGHACVFVMRVYTRIHRQIEIGCRKGLRIVAGRAPEVGVARHPAVADGHAGRQCGEACRIGRIVTAAPILVGRHQRIGAFLVVERQQPQFLFGGNFPAFRQRSPFSTA